MGRPPPFPIFLSSAYPAYCDLEVYLHPYLAAYTGLERLYIFSISLPAPFFPVYHLLCAEDPLFFLFLPLLLFRLQYTASFNCLLFPVPSLYPSCTYTSLTIWLLSPCPFHLFISPFFLMKLQRNMVFVRFHIQVLHPAFFRFLFLSVWGQVSPTDMPHHCFPAYASLPS